MARSRSSSLSGASGLMGRVVGILIVLVLLVLVGGAVFLAMWDVPAPSGGTEKVIPDARFLR